MVHGKAKNKLAAKRAEKRNARNFSMQLAFIRAARFDMVVEVLEPEMVSVRAAECEWSWWPIESWFKNRVGGESV